MAEPLAQNQNDNKDPGLVEQGIDIVGGAITDTAKVIGQTTGLKSAGEATGRSGLFDISPKPFVSYEPGMISGEATPTPSGGTLGPAMRESRELQRQDADIDTLSTMIERGQVSQIGDVSLDELQKIVAVSKNEELPDVTRNAFRTQLEGLTTIYNRTRPTGAVTSFGGETFQPTEEAYEDPAELTIQERQWAAERTIYAAVKGKFDYLNLDQEDKDLLEQIVVDSISTGSMINAAQEQAGENMIRGTAFFGGDLVLSWLPAAAVTAVEYAGRGAAKVGLGMFGASDKVRYRALSSIWQDSAEERKRMEDGWRTVLSDTAGIESFNTVFNEVIVSRLQERLADDPDRLDRILNVPLTDREGNPILGTDGVPIKGRRKLVTEEASTAVMTGSLNTLTDMEQWGVAALDTLITLGGVTKAKAATDRRALEKARKAIDDVLKGGGSRAAAIKDLSFGEQLLYLEGQLGKKKFNRRAIADALELEGAEKSFGRIANRVSDITDDLDNRRTLDGTILKEKVGSFNKGDKYSYAADLTIPDLVATRDSLKQQAFVAKLRMDGMPIIKSTAFAGLPMAAAQFYSGEYLTDVFGGDRLAAQGMGALGYMFIGRPTVKGIGFLGSKANSALGDPVGGLAVLTESIGGVVATLGRNPDFFRGTMTDSDMRDYIKLIEDSRGPGGKITFEERRALSYMKKISASLDDESREAVLASMKQYSELQTRIVSAFPQNQRVEIKRLFSETFATASNLGWMRSAAALSLGKVSANAVQSAAGMTEAGAMMRLQEKSLIQGREAIANMRRMLDESGTSPEDKAVVEKYIKTLQATLEKGETALNKQSENLDRTLEDLIEIAVADNFQEIDSSYIDQLVEAGVDASVGIVDDATELAYRNRKRALIDKALARRAENLKQSRYVGAERLDKSAKNMETTFLSFIDHAKDVARAPFNRLDERALTDKTTINVGQMIQELHRFAIDPATGEATASPSLRAFFSADQDFFRGKMGQQVLRSFEAMATRSLQERLSPAAYQKLLDTHSVEFLEDGTKNELFIKNATPFQIAMYYLDEGDFQGFQALPGEVMDVYTAFRDYAVSKRNGKLRHNYREYEQSVLQLVKNEAPEYFNDWRAAADTYKIQWFDRFDRMDGAFSGLKKSQKFGALGPAPRKVDDVEGAIPDESAAPPLPGVDQDDAETSIFAELFSYGYGKTADPGTFLVPVVRKLQSAMKGDAGDIAVAQSQIRRLIGEFADKDDQGRLFFDMSNENSKARYAALQKNFEEFLYDTWARGVVTEIEASEPQRTSRARRRTTRRSIRESGGYNLTSIDSLENVEEVQDMFNVRVINDPDAEDGIRSIVDLEGIISESKSIQRLVQREESVRKEAVKFADDFENEVRRQQKTIDRNNGVVKFSVTAVKGAAGIRSGDACVKRYLEEGDMTDIMALKGMVRSRLTGGDESIKKVVVGEGDLAIEVDIEKVIDDGIKQLLLDGLMMRGGIDVIGGRPMFTADGAENVMEGFTRPGQLAKLLENDKVFENVSEILGDDHAGFIRDIAVYMNMKADSVMGKYDPTIDKIVRGFGTNQLISRAFNIRRGMVSPQYVAAELAVAVAGQAGIDMMKLAATDEDGARFMHRFMEFPESMTKADLNAFSNLLTTFVITEFGALGLNIRDYLVGVDVSELSEEAQENIEAATAALTGEKE